MQRVHRPREARHFQQPHGEQWSRCVQRTVRDPSQRVSCSQRALRPTSRSPRSLVLASHQLVTAGQVMDGNPLGQMGGRAILR